MTQLNRLEQGGRIDRSRPLGFRFDGVPMMGFAGDTLASALLANDVRLVARSFKYHRPRGLLSAGTEEPNALVQLGTGARTTPNLRATQIPLVDDLEATSQNAWPSLRYDLGAVNNLVSPLLPAGFYYKTFMWPSGFWERYEYFIRRAAGLGRAPKEPDPDRYDHRFAHCDVLIVGAGPAGLSAALAAARTGARVVVADEQREFGGWLLNESSGANWTPEISGATGIEWVAKTVRELQGYDTVRLLPRTTVFGYYDHNLVAAVEQADGTKRGSAGIGVPLERVWKIRAQRVVLATGAIERPLVFHNNDRPGIMLAGAVRSFLNRYGVRAGTSAVLFANNDDAYRTALDLAQVGASVEAIVDVRERAEGALCAEARAQGIEVLEGYAVIDTGGWKRLRSVTVAKLSEDRRSVESTSRTIACDVLAMSGGWNPAVHLFSQARGRLQFEPERGIFIPGQAPQPLLTCGSCAGQFSISDCIKGGAKSGQLAAKQAGFSGRAARAPTVQEPVEGAWENIWVIPSDRHLDRMKAFVDFQNDVKVSDLRLAVREGYRSVEHVKRYTTQGMATDQGKTGNVVALAVVADAVGEPIHQIGTTTFRPPYTPVTFGAIAGRHTGEFLDIIRTTPMHRWHEQAGAVFEPVGQWRRPLYFPREGEDMAAAVSREVRAVREAVGMLDASTLGKIDIQGRDACELLNRVYTNAWSKLQVGKARYGLMLGEDGMVLDDGVTVRLGETRYWMSTTTGNAASVLSWLEEWLQTEWPELEVYLTSVTEHWATCSIAGPLARRLLRDVCADVDFENFAHMEARQGTVAGVPAHIFRVSFTGETGFEVNVPAGYGLSVWSALMNAGDRYGVTPYGTEAMHVLRAEKGYIIVGQETDGTVTPHDLGMDWIVSQRKADFLGKRSLTRSDIVKADRKQLVGLRPKDPADHIPEGAQIIESISEPPVPMLGHVTSSYMSEVLGGGFALALVKGGRDRIGQSLFASTGERHFEVQVCEPAFYDPEGTRLHG